MPQRSAALLLYRRRGAGIELWIAHMGGPFWARKDEAAWTVPKGLVERDDSDDLAAARREFAEELGVAPPDVSYLPLGEFRSPAKTIVVFAAETDFGPIELAGNTFDLEWPPRSGRVQAFPEVDDAGWHTLADARTKLTKGQRPILDALERLVAAGEDH